MQLLIDEYSKLVLRTEQICDPVIGQPAIAATAVAAAASAMLF